MVNLELPAGLELLMFLRFPLIQKNPSFLLIQKSLMFQLFH